METENKERWKKKTTNKCMSYDLLKMGRYGQNETRKKRIKISVIQNLCYKLWNQIHKNNNLQVKKFTKCQN